MRSLPSVVVVLVASARTAEDVCPHCQIRESNPGESHGSAFDVAVRVARLGLESSGEGVETMERYVARVARGYGVAVDTVVLPESVLITDVTSGDTIGFR
jgi:hypothetical protein